MKAFNFLRQPHFALILSMILLIFSCTHYEAIQKEEFEFDYSNFENFKITYPTIDFGKDFTNFRTYDNTVETNRALLDIINNELGTDLVYPDLALKAIEFTSEEIIDISLREGWINQKQANLTEDFMFDIQNYDFDTAITNLENSSLSLNLSEEDFEKINTFAINLKSLNYENPSLFDISTNEYSRGGWRCALAIVALASATAGLGSCVTVAACALAVALHINAIYAVSDHCGEYLE